MTSTAGLAAALLSAITQAVAHALLKSGHDKLVIRGLIGLTGAVCVLPACAVVAPPSLALWPWLAASAGIHAAYQLVLIKAYEANDFALAYPLARGVAPVATAGLGVLLLGDRLTPLGVAGIVVVSSGLLLLAVARRPDPLGLLAALTAGLLTTVYTLVDARGVRLAGDPATFIVYFFLLDGLVMTTITALVRRRRLLALMRAEGAKGVAAGLVSLITYGAALLALRLVPAGSASALRETSVVFGAVIARFALHERMDLRRIAGTLLIATGGILVILGAGR